MVSDSWRSRRGTAAARGLHPGARRGVGDDGQPAPVAPHPEPVRGALSHEMGSFDVPLGVPHRGTAGARDTFGYPQRPPRPGRHRSESLGRRQGAGRAAAAADDAVDTGRADGDARSAAQAGGSPFDAQVNSRLRGCTGGISLRYRQQERPSPTLVRALTCGNTVGVTGFEPAASSSRTAFVPA
jgi:hypothetical protein